MCVCVWGYDDGTCDARRRNISPLSPYGTRGGVGSIQAVVEDPNPEASTAVSQTRSPPLLLENNTFPRPLCERRKEEKSSCYAPMPKREAGEFSVVSREKEEGEREGLHNQNSKCSIKAAAGGEGLRRAGIGHINKCHLLERERERERERKGRKESRNRRSRILNVSSKQRPYSFFLSIPFQPTPSPLPSTRCTISLVPPIAPSTAGESQTDSRRNCYRKPSHTSDAFRR